MIKSFRSKSLEKFYLDGDERGIQPHHSEKLGRILDTMDSAHNIKDMNYPGSNLHKLEPKTKDIWSVDLSGNWRIVFKYKEGDFYQVELKDTH